MTAGVIITATGTSIGKTVFAAALVDTLKADYWKPIQAGLDGETDTKTVQRLANASPERLHPEAYRLTTPCSPHRAAELDALDIDPKKLSTPVQSPNGTRPLIIEGAGGLLVPLTRTFLQIDQFATWNLPLILCACTQLGTINHTLLSIEAINSRGLSLQGIAFIGTQNPDTQATIADISGAKILGTLPMLTPLNHKTLKAAFAKAFCAQDCLPKP